MGHCVEYSERFCFTISLYCKELEKEKFKLSPKWLEKRSNQNQAKVNEIDIRKEHFWKDKQNWQQKREDK